MQTAIDTAASGAGVELREDKSFVRAAYRKQLGPVCLSVLLVQLSSILNNVVVGRLIGSGGLAVMSAVTPVYFTFSTVGALLSAGGSTLAARRIGENDATQANSAFTISVVLLAICGAALTALGLVFRGPLLAFLGVPEDMKALANGYLTAYLPGAIGVMGFYIPFHYLKLVGKQNQSVLLFLAMAIVNIGLDLLLAGALKMGMIGVGMASAAGAWTAFLIGLALLCGKRGSFRLLKPVDIGGTLKQIVRFGSPSATNNLCNTLFSLSMNHIILSRLGGMGLAAFSLIMTLRSLSMTLSNGVSMTMAPFAAVFSSERDSESLRQLLLSALTAGIPLMLAFSGLAFFFPARFCALFGVTAAEKLAVALPAIRWFALSLPAALINFTLIAFYANQGKTLLSNAMTILRALALVAPLALAFSAGGNGEALWRAFPAAEIGAMGIGLLCAYWYSAKRPHLARLSLIDRSYEDDGRFIAFSVAANDEAAAESARRIGDFCEANELAPRTGMAISLALEEMLVIFNKHALEIQKQTRSAPRGATVRLLIYRADTIILRMRCFGKPFDPLKAAETDAEADDAQEYIGVRMIQKLAKTVVYTHTFGINTVTITI